MNNSPQDVEQQFKHIGQRLALLLASSDLPDEVKEAWAALIPEMSLEQIDRLTSILADSLRNVSDGEMQAFTEAIEQAKANQAEQVQKAEAKALKELEDIEAMIDSSS